MMENKENMVLRTLYIPRELDRELKAYAFTKGVSKAEVMRVFIVAGVEKLRASGQLPLAEQLDAGAAGGAAPADDRLVLEKADAA